MINDPFLRKPSWREFLWFWSKTILGYILIASLLLSSSYRLSPVLTIFLSMFLGWNMVWIAYMPINNRMTSIGDGLLFLTAGSTVYFALKLIAIWCYFFLNISHCGKEIVGGAIIAIVLPGGILFLSMWLWFRIIQWRRG